MPHNSLGERLKAERERLGYTQTEFAEIVGASKRSQIGWEQGRSAPDVTALAIWVGEGLDAGYLLTGERSNVATSQHLPADEQVLIEAYRGLNALKRKALLADLLTGGKKTKKTSTDTSEKTAVSVVGDGNRTAGRDFNEQ